MTKVFFNGSELTKYFKVLNVQRELLPPRENYVIESELRHGADYDGFKYGSRVTTIEVAMLTDSSEELQKQKREVAEILDTEEPAKLSFSDEPDVYYLAVFEGTAAVEQLGGTGTFELQFISHDPFAYSVEETVISNDGKSTITVENNGTHIAFPVIEAEMTSNNSLVAYINKKGSILQFGDPDLVDAVAVKRPEFLINDRNMGDKAAVEASGWKVNADTFTGKFLGQHTLTANGTIKYYTESSVKLLGIDSYGTGTDYKGICLSKNIPADSSGHVGADSFDLKVGLFFVTGQIPQTGLSLVELRDKNDVQVCSLSYYKNTTTNNTASIRLNVRNKYVATVKSFDTTHWNTYTSMGTELGIYKRGSVIEFHTGGWQNGGVAMSMDFDFLKDVEVTKVLWYGGVYRNFTPMHNAIRSVTFQKKDVDAVEAVPTLFGKDDVLTANTASGIVTVGELGAMGLDTLGNNWESFYLEKGKNEITVVQSAFATVPEVKIKFRERWL